MSDEHYTTATKTNQIVNLALCGAAMIRLLIVEDQPAVRKGLRMLFAAEPDLSVLGEASDGGVAVELALSLCPDVVLMDVEMPHMDGIATARALHLIRPRAAVIMLSIHDDALTRACALQAGAAAFVAKSMPAETLLMTIREVARASETRPTLPAVVAPL